MKEGIWAVDSRYRDMVSAELLILGVLSALTLVSVIILGLWIRIELANMLELLDERLALALKSTIDRLMEGGMAEFEPPNPIQGAIAQLIQGMAQQKLNTIDAVVTNRGDNGQFMTAEETP